MEARVMVMAGGTGGHVFPALAVAQVLQQSGLEVFWLGTPHGLEAKLVPQRGIRVEWINLQGLRGSGIQRWLQAPFRLAVAMGRVFSVLRRLRPRVVLGMGGFVAGPGGVVAWLLRIPLVIHEQNAVPGLTNRWLARLASRVFEAFPGSFPTRYKAQACGNPVRAEIVNIAAPPERFAGRSGKPRLLILGGSQGARRLNEMLPRTLAGMGPESRPQVRHQAGDRNLQTTQAAYESAGVDAEVTPFIEDMAEAYAWSDLAICRAGALTISELAAAGVGAVLVPYPFAVDDHQTRNARVLVDAGGAILLPESDLDEHALLGVLSPLLGDRNRLFEMAKAARQVARTEAAETVARACIEVQRR